MFYIYKHTRLDKNIPFYVGVGTCRKNPNSFYQEHARAYSLTGRNTIWQSITQKTDYRVDIVFYHEDRDFIFEKEKEFIKLYGRIDLGNGILSNMTDGGDTGFYNQNFETRRKKGLSNSTKIYHYNNKGEYLGEFDSISDACRKYKSDNNYVSVTALKQAIDLDRPMYGFKWYYQYKGETISKFSYHIHNTVQPIKVYKKDTNEYVSEYPTIRSCARDLNLIHTSIRKVLSGKLKSTGGYTVCYSSE